jgi:DNA polymerase V
LKSANEYKENLFSTIGNEKKRKKLMDAIDYTNIKYGRNSLSVAQAGLKKRWNIKKQYSSKIDTASFPLLPTIGSS